MSTNLCITSFWCRYSTPSSICLVYLLNTASSRAPNLARILAIEPPGTNCMKMLTMLSSRLVPIYLKRKLSHILRKPVFAICKQQRRRSACAPVQSDQHLCCSLPGWHNISTCYIRNFKTLASFCSCADWFESYPVATSRRHIFS